MTMAKFIKNVLMANGFRWTEPRRTKDRFPEQLNFYCEERTDFCPSFS